MAKLSYIIIVLLFSSKLSAQVAFSNPIESFKSEAQLQELYLKYGNLLVINNLIYQIPCDCLPCRNFGGQTENRNLGGQTENRKLGGQTENRNLRGQTENRKLGGQTENRNLGGQTENRKLGGQTENRKLGGQTENRKLGGQTENRNLGGMSEILSCKNISSNEFLILHINPNTIIKFYNGYKLHIITDLRVKL